MAAWSADLKADLTVARLVAQMVVLTAARKAAKMVGSKAAHSAGKMAGPRVATTAALMAVVTAEQKVVPMVAQMAGNWVESSA